MVSDLASYSVDEDGSVKKNGIWTVSGRIRDERMYTYGEAINLAGNGKYSIGLLTTLSVATLAMGVDMFGFSVIVSGCTCDFQLNMSQTSILLSMPFVGPIVMAYPWGYISDTQGRKKSLLVALWTSFLVSTLSAFSPNWVCMAVLKFISTSFCSCAQSATYTLLGECCSERVRDSYMLIMTSVLDFSLAAYVAVAYFILNLDFSYDLGFIGFTPWRLLTLVLALPLGLGAVGMHFYYESPKFLVNAGRVDQALDHLRGIWRRNGGETGQYPVKKVYLDEVGNERHKDIPLLRSLWEQIVPLFRPPLLSSSLKLYFLTAVVYSTNNSYFIWFPYLADKFTSGLKSIPSTSSNSTDDGHAKGLCNMIVSVGSHVTGNTECTSDVSISLVWSSLGQGVTFVMVLLAITRLAHYKRILMMVILFVSSASAIGAVTILDNITSFVLFFGLLLNELCIGFIFTYFVDLYPTSYRGMAACLAVMVARGSALGGVNLLGAFIMSNCSTTFYGCSALMFCAIIVTWFLPPDKGRKSDKI